MFDKVKKATAGASTGISVVAGFIGAALILLQLVKTVSQDEAVSHDGQDN